MKEVLDQTDFLWKSSAARPGSYPSVAGVLLQELPELVEEDVARSFSLKQNQMFGSEPRFHHRTSHREAARWCSVTLQEDRTLVQVFRIKTEFDRVLVH